MPTKLGTEGPLWAYGRRRPVPPVPRFTFGGEGDPSRGRELAWRERLARRAAAELQRGGKAAGDLVLNYFSKFSALNVLHQTARSLEEDVRVPARHAFVGHNLAMAYNGCNKLAGNFRPFKLRIREQFDAITAQEAPAELGTGDVEWAAALVRDLARFIEAGPPKLVREDLAPVRALLGLPAGGPT